MRAKNLVTGRALGWIASILSLAAGCVGAPDSGDTLSVAADSKTSSPVQERLDPLGVIESDSTNAFAAGATNGLFADLGTNGRTCNTCHIVEDGWTITPSHVRGCPPRSALHPQRRIRLPADQRRAEAEKALSSQLVDFGLFGSSSPFPAPPALAGVRHQPAALRPGAGIGGGGRAALHVPPAIAVDEFDFRFDDHVGRAGEPAEDHHRRGFPGRGAVALRPGRSGQFGDHGHAQGAAIAGTPAQADILSFETNLYSAQSSLAFQPLD